MSKELYVYFVLPSHCEDELSTSKDMQEAFELARQNLAIIEWVRECDVEDKTYDKTNMLVFEKFEGKVFQKVCKNRCLIIGPRCLLTAFIDNVAVPDNGSPIYNLAMRNMRVAISNLQPEKKKELKEKILLMGGFYCLHVTTNVQYLISSGVRSQKYMMAANNNVPIMKESWVNAVWEESLKRNTLATDPEYFKAHKLPTFDQLCISSSGLDERERNEIKTLIETNGGTFSAKMSVPKTNMLICKVGVKSEKFTVAIKSKIPCVAKEWVSDSVKAGVALMEDAYSIKVSSSTPTKFGMPADLNFSTMSAIAGPSGKLPMNNSNHTMDQTNMSVLCATSSFNHTLAKSAQKSVKKEIKDNIESLITNIDLKEVKSAGPFLDGCSIYLAGFSSTAREKLCRILKIAGATRYDDVSDRVTQVIVGDVSSHELKLFSTKGCVAPIVSVKWLLESIRIQVPAFEDNFIVSIKGSPAQNEAPASPLVKKGLNLLRANTSMVDPNKDTLSKCLNFEPDQDESIMKQYLTKAREEEEDTLARLIADGSGFEGTKKDKTKTQEPPAPSPKVPEPNPPNESTMYDEEDTNLPIFQDKSFVLIGFDEEYLEQLTYVIEQKCGIVKSPKFNGIPDYAVVPVFIDDLRINASEIVNSLWILDCNFENEIIPINYYHQPIVNNKTTRPLENCVITISNYTKRERVYLQELLEHLGADYQEKFARTAQDDVKASTHLICLNPTGKKYEAAVKWGIPIVTGKWLLECLRLDSKVNENMFGFEENSGKIQLESKTPAKPSHMESIKNPNYFPSVPKSNKAKLDVSVVKQHQEIPSEIKSKVTPQPSKSPFAGFENKSIEKSCTVSKEIHKEASFINNEYETPKYIQKEKRALKFTPDSASTSKQNCLEEKDMNTPKTICATPGPSKTPDQQIGLQSKENYDGDGFIVIDGEKMLLSKYMQGLRDQGLFDRGSPADGYNVSPYVVPKNLTEYNNTPKTTSNANHDESYQPSQDTPVGKYIKGLQQRNVLPSNRKMSTPDSPLPRSQFDVATPNTPLGAFMCENDPSPETRKYWERRLNRFPHYKMHDRPPVKKDRRLSTPLSEVKRQAWDMLLGNEKQESVCKKPKLQTSYINDQEDEKDKEEDVTTVPETESQIADSILVTNQLKQLQNMMKSNDSSGNRRGSLLRIENDTPQRTRLSRLQTTLFHESHKDSQPDTVGWDDPVEAALTNQDDFTIPNEQPRKFMLSTISNDVKHQYEEIIQFLGGTVSTAQTFDPTATHLVCAAPSRNEKILSSMASGKFIVHTAYLSDSKEAGKFLDEELYEFGNPKSLSKIKVEVKAGTNIESFYWWRQKIAEQEHYAFSEMRIVLFANNKAPIARLIEAGGGVVVNITPPFKHNVDATHCLIEGKSNPNLADFIPLAKQGIPCLNMIFLSTYLNTLGEVNKKEHIPLELQDYYN